MMKFCLGILMGAWGAAYADSTSVDSILRSADSLVIQSEADLARMRARQIDSLLIGRLSPDAAPFGFLGLDYRDEQALMVEKARLEAMFTGIEAAQKKAKREKRVALARIDSIPLFDSTLFQARLEWDRSRLMLFRLPKSTRDSLLTSQSEAYQAKKKAESASKIELAEKRARETEAAKNRALAAANQARTEAEKLVSEEFVRLLVVSESQADFELNLARQDSGLKVRAEKTLGFRRTVRESETAREPHPNDALYDELRAFLRSSRVELASAMSEMFAKSEVPTSGPDRLMEISIPLDRGGVDSLRESIRRGAIRLGEIERRYREIRTAQLYAEVRDLNIDRLALIDGLSLEKRKAIRGIGVEGLNQAASELRHVSLLLQYQVMATRLWFANFGNSTYAKGKYAALATWVTVKLLFLCLAFYWWRRRGQGILANWQQFLREEDYRTRAESSNWLIALIGYVQQFRSTLDWFVFVTLLLWLLPDAVRGLLGVDILGTIVLWIIGGSLSVGVVNALAGGLNGQLPRRHGAGAADVRLKSLRLVSRTIVIFGLILVISVKLVGQGTVYEWVWTLCWIAILPVTLLIIRWWRKIIFERIVAVRKKKWFENWVTANQAGWKSFPAAVMAGIYLFSKGFLLVTRNWLTGFQITRKGLAYLFKRELNRLAEGKSNAAYKPLSAEMFESLGPEAPSSQTISNSADAEVARIESRILQEGGGIFAVIGERGSGKTRSLRRVQSALSGVIILKCGEARLEGLREELAKQLGLENSADLETCVAEMSRRDEYTALIIDSAHELIQPFIGGLAEFDKLIGLSRSYSKKLCWLFAMDSVVWRFLSRMREGRLLFDDVIHLEPWKENEIAQLLMARSDQSGIQPSFEHLIESLPVDADAIDRAEALARTKAGYFRIIWDHSGGNPGIALHMWRLSLGVDDSGTIRVKVFKAPEARDLDELPDTAVFVLRAVIQLEPAEVEKIIQTTMLRPQQVGDALRFSLARGYLESKDGRYRITWQWFRTISRFLQRRHLLAN